MPARPPLLDPAAHQRPSWLAWLPQLDRTVWLLAIGRVLLQFGTGFVLFYAAIYFVNRVGLSAAAVGLALGLGQILGVGGRLASGALADSPRWGRRRVLLAAAIISLLADLVLFFAHDFAGLVGGNLLMGLGVGLYWPAMEALIADLTPEDRRREAYAVTRLSDTIGLGLGTITGGLIVGLTGAYRWLFLADAVSFLIFAGVIWAFIPRSTVQGDRPVNHAANWRLMARDRPLQIFLLANLAFTTYVAQTETTLPIYLKNVAGFSEGAISALFTWHIAWSALAQLPMTRLLGRFSHPHALKVAAGLFAIAFGVFWGVGVGGGLGLGLAGLGLAVLALAIVSYTPAGSAIVAEMAPQELRGTYLSVNSLCWAAGYAVGPPLGGLALDASPQVARLYWLALAASVAVTVGLLVWLERSLGRSTTSA